MKILKGKLQNVIRKKSFRTPKKERLSEAEIVDLKNTFIEIELRDK